MKEFPNFLYYKGKINRIYPEDRESEGAIVIKDYLAEEEIGYFPDLKKVSKAIGGARNLHKYWNRLEKKDRVEILEQAGEELEKKDELDKLISRAGGFPIRFVREARENFADYLKQSEEFLQENPGKGPVIAATSVTTPEVQPYVMIESLLGNCSVTIKGNSSEPFSAYLLSEISEETDLPIQFITYQTKGKESFATEFYKMCEEEGGHFILMGDPITPKRIAYYEILDKVDISTLPMPKNMVAFTSHGGCMIVDESGNTEDAVEGALYSFRFPKACKVPTCIFVHKDRVEEFADELVEKVKKQKVGDVLDEDTEIAEVSEKYWEELVEPFLRVAKSDGETLVGGDINQPSVIKGNFYLSLWMEPHFPIYCIEEFENVREKIEKINKAGKNLGGRILDLSVYSDDQFFEELEKLRREGSLRVYTLHKNSPTTFFDPKTAHEGIILREYLAEPNFVQK